MSPQVAAVPITGYMKLIPVGSIREMNPRLRKLNQEKVAELADSIGKTGLVNPLTVYPASVDENDIYALSAGKHRLEACISLGWTEVLVIVMTMSDMEAQIVEIDENLIRAELTDVEREIHLAERKRLYEEAHPETRHGVAGAVAKHATANLATAPTPSFVDDTAKKTKMSKRTIRRAVRRAECIATDVMQTVLDTPKIATNGAERDALADMPRDQQAEAVDMLRSGEVASIRAYAEKQLEIELDAKRQRRWELEAKRQRLFDQLYEPNRVIDPAVQNAARLDINSSGMDDSRTIDEIIEQAHKALALLMGRFEDTEEDGAAVNSDKKPDQKETVGQHGPILRKSPGRVKADRMFKLLMTLRESCGAEGFTKEDYRAMSMAITADELKTWCEEIRDAMEDWLAVNKELIGLLHRKKQAEAKSKPAKKAKTTA